MTDLLRTGFVRMRKAPVFWLGVVFMAGYGLQVCRGIHDSAQYVCASTGCGLLFFCRKDLK